jgi:glutathione S-transferase
MADAVDLHGYRYSVYTRTARLALLSKQVEHRTIEVDPFAERSEAYLELHPFGRVPR